MRAFLFLITPLLFVVSCSSFQKKLSPTADKSLLFPPGVYTHQVDIETGSVGRYSFRGVVKIARDKVIVVGLSPFQTTIFKIEENRKTGEIKADVYQDTLEKHRDSLMDFYKMLSAFLTLPRNGEDPKIKVYERDKSGNLKEVGVLLKGQETKIKVFGYDANGIAEQFKIYHPKFKVSVVVVGYEG